MLVAFAPIASHLQPSDFSLIRVREALPGERPTGEHGHLVVNGIISKSVDYGALADFYGISLERVEPETLLVKEAIGDANTPPPEWPKFASAASTACIMEARGKVVQLWGVTHSVNAVLPRLVAAMESAVPPGSAEAMRPALWRQVITVGASDAHILPPNFKSHHTAKASALLCLVYNTSSVLLAVVVPGSE